MNTEYLTKYISLIKAHGLAVNNLYLIDISMPRELIFNTKINEYYTGTKSNQIDLDKTIQNNNALSGLFNVNKYKTGFNNIKDGVSGMLGGNKKPNETASNASPTSQMHYWKQVSMLCTSVDMPFYKQKVNNTFINHMTHKFATGLDTDPINMTFYIDRNNIIMNVFSSWQDLINNSGIYSYDIPEGMMAYKSQYISPSITISMINKNLEGPPEEFYITELVGAFPSSIQPFKLNNGNTELLQLNVTFEFDKIKHEIKQLVTEDPIFTPPNALSGFNILDAKNSMNDALSAAKGMINNVASDVKGAVGQVNSAKKSITGAFK